jgi:hypothetical protein
MSVSITQEYEKFTCNVTLDDESVIAVPVYYDFSLATGPIFNEVSIHHIDFEVPDIANTPDYIILDQIKEAIQKRFACRVDFNQ